MEIEATKKLTETLQVWETPVITEYDAKAEIQGLGIGRNEALLLTS